MFTDIVGYTALMERDEQSALGARDRHRTLLKTLVEQFHGEVIESPGDEALVLFDSALHAVDCGLALQAALRDDSDLAVRVGIHLGDVVLGDGEVAGEGVNLAARIRPVSAPGGICISEPVYQAVRNRKHVVAHPLGSQSFKNVAEPLRVYALDTEPTAQLQPQRSTARWGIGLAVTVVAVVVVLAWWLYEPTPVPTGPPLTAIAVLPFDDLSPDGDQAWLADAMTEALTENLSRIDGTRVPARTSTERLKEQKADIATIGEKLKVGSVVEGSVQRSGDNLQVTVQLIPVQGGDHLWSARYQRGIEDVFEVQQEITEEIAEAIRADLGLREVMPWERASRYTPKDVRAYELVRRGVQLFGSGPLGGFPPESLEYFEQAVEIDPNYSTAYSWMATYYTLAPATGDMRKQYLSKARTLAEKALALGPTNPQNYFTVALVEEHEYNWEAALELYHRALKLDPRNGFTHWGVGDAHLFMGRLDQALPYLRRAVQLNSYGGSMFDTPIIKVSLGYALFFAGDFDEAQSEFEATFDLAPHIASAGNWVSLALAYRAMELDEAAMEVAVRWSPPEAEVALREAYKEAGWSGSVRALLDYELSRSNGICTDSLDLGAVYYALLGEADKMFACLDLWPRLGYGYLAVPQNVIWSPYRDDPRFHALLRKWNLEDAPFASE